MLDLVKLLAVLTLTVFLLLKKWDLGLILVLNSLLVAVLFAYPLPALPLSMWRGLTANDTLYLALAVFLVLMLAELLRRTESMTTMVQALGDLVPDGRIVVGLMPLLIGLMPMLGGAMFSAPMVNVVGDQLKLDADRKTFINYWFRHSMEYVFPLYSSLLLMSTLVGVSVFDFIRVSWPLSLVTVAGGVMWGIVGIRKPSRSQDVGKQQLAIWGNLLGSMWPLLLVILAVAVFKFNMIVSLLCIIALVVLLKRIPADEWGDIAKCSFPIHTFSAIFGVMLFKRVLEDAGAVQQIPMALSSLGLPPLLVALIVPLMIGSLTGVAAAAMALSAPLVLPLLTATGIAPVTAGVWLFVGGFSGVLLSPMHLCLTLTQDYFGASWRGLYQRIVPAVALVILAGWVLVMLRSG